MAAKKAISEVNENERSFERSLSEVMSEVELEKIMPIVKYLQEQGNISPQKARELTGKSAATVRRYLSILCERGILTASGKTNSLVYTLNDQKIRTKTESNCKV